MSKQSVLLKLCVAFLISSPLAAQTVTTDTTKVTRIISTVGSKSDTSLLYSLPWKANQRIMVSMQDTLVNYAGDTIRGRVYARDVNNVPVTNPQFMWSFSNAAIFEITTTADNKITLVGRDGLYYYRNSVGVTWNTFTDSANIISGLPQTDTLESFPQFRLDTVHLYDDPKTGLTRKDIVNVDSAGPFEFKIDRIASDSTPFQVWFREDYPYAHPDSTYITGGIVYSTPPCPLMPGYTPSMMVRWIRKMPMSNPMIVNSIATWKLAKAAVAQLPFSAIQEMGKLSIERFLLVDPFWFSGLLTYQECIGPWPPQ